MPILINGQRVDDAVVDAEFSNIKAYHESLGNVSCCERDPEFRATARDNVIARVLLAQEAARAVEPTPDPDVDAALAKLKEDYGGEQWFMARTGLTEETLPLVRRDLDIDLRTRRLVERLTEGTPAPSDDDLRRYYQEHIGRFMTDEEVRASHILKGGGGENRVEGYEDLRKVRKQLLAGADFDALAKAHSDKAEDSIDQGFFKRNELTPEFESVAFSMEVGEVSPIFTSSYGFHLIKLTDRKPSIPRPFEEVRGEVEQRWREDLRAEKARELVERLKGGAAIEEIDPDAEAAEIMGAPAEAGVGQTST
jgi:peptidyl-prolyl cis-trans isomerase C